jgi:hypothetical protein
MGSPESNNILMGVSLIEKVPISTEAPSGMLLMVVKFSLPWRTYTIDFLAGLADLVAAP